MRFVRLNQEPIQSPYTTILKNGCGPNFVFNRLDAFETMMKEQGVTFWFRFWLKFCLIPGCNDLKAIQEQWPDKKSYANINIHEQLLNGSVEDAVKFCLETAIARLRVSGSENKSGEGTVGLSKKSFYCLLQECSEMAFAASLCEVFYQWLISKEKTKDSPNYWSIPRVYLSPKFKPGLLEHFLVKRWGDNLMPLLGITHVRQIPWLFKWNKTQGKVSHENYVERSEHPMLMQNIADVLKTHREQRRLETDVADELPNAPKNYLTFNMVTTLEFNESPPKDIKNEMQLNTTFSFANGKVHVISKTKNKSRHLCAFCGSVELVRNLYKKCKSCLLENWLEPRYYCSLNCEMEHWFQIHQREHANMESESTT